MAHSKPLTNQVVDTKHIKPNAALTVPELEQILLNMCYNGHSRKLIVISVNGKDHTINKNQIIETPEVIRIKL